MTFLEYTFNGISFPTANAFDVNKPFRLIVERYSGVKPLPIEASVQKFSVDLYPGSRVCEVSVSVNDDRQLVPCSVLSVNSSFQDSSIQIISDQEIQRLSNVVSPHKNSGYEVGGDSIGDGNLDYLPSDNVLDQIINHTSFFNRCYISHFGNDLSHLLSSTVKYTIEAEGSQPTSSDAANFFNKDGSTSPIEHETEASDTLLPVDIMKFILTHEKYNNPNGEPILPIEGKSVSLNEETLLILDDDESDQISDGVELAPSNLPPDPMIQPSLPSDPQHLCDQSDMNPNLLPTSPLPLSDCNLSKFGDEFISPVNFDAFIPVESDPSKSGNVKNFFYGLDSMTGSDHGANDLSDSDLSLDLDMDKSSDSPIPESPKVSKKTTKPVADKLPTTSNTDSRAKESHLSNVESSRTKRQSSVKCGTSSSIQNFIKL